MAMRLHLFNLKNSFKVSSKISYNVDMKLRNFVFQALFFALLFFQTYLIAFFDQNINSPQLQQLNDNTSIKVSHYSINLFIFVVFIAFFVVFFSLSKLKNEKIEGRRIISAIIAYIVYQFIIVLPLAYLYKIGSSKDLFYSFLTKSPLILVPLFLWFILPTFKKCSKVLGWISLSSIILLLAAIYNYNIGRVLITDTGQIRLLSGGAALIFATVFFVNLFTKNRSVWNFFFVIVGLLGIVSVNFRSAYLFLVLVVLVGALLYGSVKSRAKMLVLSFLTILSVIGIISQNTIAWENFSNRIESISWQDGNVQGRIDDWKLAWQRFEDSPLNGSIIYNEYYRSIYYDHLPPHNFILELLSTQGLIGTLFYLYVLFESFRTAYRNKQDQTSLQMFLVLMFYVLFASFNVTFLSQWTLLIMILAISIIFKRDNEFQPISTETLQNEFPRN